MIMEEQQKIIRVIHVVKVMNQGGAETMIMNIYRNIDRKKVQFDFLCMTDEKGAYDDEIKELGGRIFYVDSPDDGRVKNLKQIYKLLKENKDIKVVHSHISFYSGFVCFIAYLAKINLRISHSHTTSDTRTLSLVRRLYNKLARMLVRKFSNVKLACGKEAGIYLYQKQDFKIIKNGIDLDKYTNVSKEETLKLKEELNIKSHELVIGHIGRFETVKNHEYFIKLAESMRNKNIKFKIVLVGIGSLYESIKEKINSRKLQNYFVLPGPRSDINIFMNLFDIFVMPSLYEGFPLTVVEALAGNNICYLSNTISKETNIIRERINYFDITEDCDKLISLILDQHVKEQKQINVKQILKKEGYSIKDMALNIMYIYLEGKNDI